MGLRLNEVEGAYGLAPAPDRPNDREKDSDEAPETPLDEPRPPRVQDPPPEHKGPYVVQAQGW
jgi:hypothetical protein